VPPIFISFTICSDFLSQLLMQSLTRKKNFDWINVAKGIAIILVVYRHNLVGLERSGFEIPQIFRTANEIVYSFRMPLFFMISGLFIAKSIVKRQGWSFVTYKFNSIYYPYLIWGVIQIGLQVLLSEYTNSDRSLVDFTYLLISPRQVDQLWYLFALFNCSILFYFFHSVLKIKAVVHLVISILMFAFSTFLNDINLIHDLFYYYIFLTLGHHFKNLILDESYSKRQLFYMFLGITPIFWLSQWYWLNHPDLNLFLFGIIAVLGTIYVFVFSRLVENQHWLNFIKVAGRHSLQIYLMHVLVISSFRIIVTKFLGLEFPIVILFVGWVIGNLIPIVFYELTKHTFFIYLFQPKRNLR